MMSLKSEMAKLKDRWNDEIDAIVRDQPYHLSSDDIAPPVPKQLHWWHVQLCRQMCQSAGYDPDAMVVDTKGPVHGPLGSVLATSSVPAWTLYEDAARAALGERE